MTLYAGGRNEGWGGARMWDMRGCGAAVPESALNTQGGGSKGGCSEPQATPGGLTNKTAALMGRDSQILQG